MTIDQGQKIFGGRVSMHFVSAVCLLSTNIINIFNNCNCYIQCNVSNNWCQNRKCKKVQLLSGRLRFRAKTEVSLSTSKRFEFCFSNKPLDGVIFSFKRILDNTNMIKWIPMFRRACQPFWNSWSQETMVMVICFWILKVSGAEG